jgi:two-component system sensor histidine kinase RegB
MPGEPTSANITLRTFVVARWVLLGLIALGWVVQLGHPPTWIKIISWFPPPPEPRGTSAVMLVLIVGNLVTQRWILRPGRATPSIAGAHLLVDAAALTALLALSGGVANPFTTMLFVPITLATQISPRWTWILALSGLIGFALLFVVTPEVAHEARYGVGSRVHIRGMWVAFAVSGVFMTYFVQRIATSLARQRQELSRLRDEALQDRNLAALGTLAAGAAHELGSPLGTISALVGDLNLMDEAERSSSIETIRQQLRRCKHIIHQMASPELRVPMLGRVADEWHLRVIEDELQDAVVEIPLRVRFTPEVHRVSVRQPRAVIGQILRELVSNGGAACRERGGAREGVRVSVDVVAGAAVIEVQDDGAGMNDEALAHAFDPFFSTKVEGQGLGLGLYLARAHLRQLGGTITLRSVPEQGTRVRVEFPLSPEHAQTIA